MGPFTENIKRLVEFTPQHLKLAQTISAHNNHQTLSQFFKEKIQEELGHDQWGVDDLRVQKKLGSQLRSSVNIPEMNELITFNQNGIGQSKSHGHIYTVGDLDDLSSEFVTMGRQFRVGVDRRLLLRLVVLAT